MISNKQIVATRTSTLTRTKVHLDADAADAADARAHDDHHDHKQKRTGRSMRRMLDGIT